MSKAEEESFLLSQFRTFYGELINLKRLLKSGKGFIAEDSSGDSATDYAATIAERLTEIMERQAMVAGRRGSDYTGLYGQAEYVMAVLADEVLLHHVEWIGKDVWQYYLLEHRMFQSRIAGEEFFRRIDRLLQTSDPIYKDLATVYLLAIMLGFRGKYSGGNDSGNIDFYRRQLFIFIFHGSPELKEETKKLFPDAYLHTVAESGEKSIKAPQVAVWYLLLAALVVFYVLVSRIVWTNSTTDLEGITSRIERLLPQ